MGLPEAAILIYAVILFNLFEVHDLIKHRKSINRNRKSKLGEETSWW